MSDEAQLALVNSLPTIIASIGTVVMAVVAYRIQQGKDDDKEALNKVGEKLEIVHQQTNSNLTEAKDQIKALNLLVREMLTEQAAEAKALIPPAIPPGQGDAEAPKE